MKPMFSIIIPVYNVEKYLCECVDSVLTQSYTDLEVILVDDGSPDRCPEICDEYARRDPRVQVIHKPNGGQTSARKAGIKASRGEYVLYVDSDDLIVPDLLSIAAEIIEKYQPDVYAFDFVLFDEDGQQTEYHSLVSPALYHGESMQIVRDSLILDKNGNSAISNSLCTKITKRELLLKHQMAVPEEMRNQGEDLAVTGPLLAHCDSICFSDFIGYRYRIQKESSTNTLELNKLHQYRQVVSYLETKMGSIYEERLNTSFFSFYMCYIDWAASTYSYRRYCEFINASLTPDAAVRLEKAFYKGKTSKERMLVFLVRHRWFALLWLLRKMTRSSKE